MTRIRITLFTVIAMAFVLSSCGDEVTAPVTGNTDKRPSEVQYQLEEASTIDARSLWDSSERASYEKITATITPANGGALIGTTQSWGPDKTFKMVFPPGAIPGFRDVTVTMLIPANDGSNNPPVFKFEPDMEFNSPVAVTVHWPEWIPHASAYTSFFCLNRSGPFEPTLRYWITDMKVATTPPGSPSGMTFLLNHFSRWGAQNGKMGDG